MPALLIAYDLNKPGQNYPDLHNRIKSLGAWLHCEESLWIVDTRHTVESAKDQVLATMDKSDSLLVVDISRDSYAGWLPEGHWTWIREHV